MSAECVVSRVCSVPTDIAAAAAEKHNNRPILCHIEIIFYPIFLFVLLPKKTTKLAQ